MWAFAKYFPPFFGQAEEGEDRSRHLPRSEIKIDKKEKKKKGEK